MFIARRNPDLRRRSEERELTSPITTRSLPLLRTALGMLFVVGYKHVTPSGVKKLASSQTLWVATPLRWPCSRLIISVDNSPSGIYPIR
jgi:hypothetical protein